MAFFSRHTPAFGAEFAPLFRLLDEGLDVNRTASRHSSVRAWSPRFDVKEHKDNYLLEGELPGIEQKNVEIEFTDPHTLVIKGRTEHEYTSTTPAIEDSQTAGAIEAASDSRSESHQPTVEDEDEPSNSTTVVAPTKKPLQVAKPTQAQTQPQFKSWISERSIGEFHRSFSFPSRVDQDAVKASLKNGILSIIVPKATAAQNRKINIE